MKAVCASRINGGSQLAGRPHYIRARRKVCARSAYRASVYVVSFFIRQPLTRCSNFDGHYLHYFGGGGILGHDALSVIPPGQSLFSQSVVFAMTNLSGALRLPRNRSRRFFPDPLIEFSGNFF
jgi:hypothetical protein